MIPGPRIRGDQSGDLDTGGSAGYANMVVFGPNSEMKYVAPNSSRNGSSAVVALGASQSRGLRGEAVGLQQLAGDPFDGGGGQYVSVQRGDCEDRQHGAGLAGQSGVRRYQLDNHWAGDGVAVAGPKGVRPGVLGGTR